MTILDDPSLYSIGWIAALPIERAAATALLDERHETPQGFEQHQSDTNAYTWGRVGEHNIVIASLPAGVYGTTSAATTASNLLSSLPQIRIGLLVGIGGAVARPDQDRDIRLGDVVVSQPEGTEGGVVQYDLGKATSNDSWERKGSLNMPPPVLLHALASLQAEHEISPSKVPDLLHGLWTANPQMKKPKTNPPAYVHQGFENDRLFMPTYDHAGGDTCSMCDISKEVQRSRRDTTDPDIHYGVIGSGNSLIKDAATRDKIADGLGTKCICFEMEAAGLMIHFPCLVIRGICDYADSHKNDRWQRYASATAAAYAKELLGFVPVKQLQATQRAIDNLRSFSEDLKRVQSVVATVKEAVQDVSTAILDIDQKTILARLEDEVAVAASFDSHAEVQSPRCLPGTRVELLDQISEWANDPRSEAIFWLNGMAGTGKSTVARTVATSFAAKNHLGATFFFKRGEADRGTMAKLFSTIAADLVRRKPATARHIKRAIDSDPTILRKAIPEQFDRLIWDPILMIPLDVRRREPIVVIVDALDECEQEDAIKLMIHLFCRARTQQSMQLKIFLTSRPDLPIRLGFKAIEGKYRGLILHEIPEPVVERDIRAFLEHELRRIRDEYNALGEDRHLADDWPGHSSVETMVKMAIPLFIYAATMCLFIADRRIGTPDKQLKKVLRAGGRLSQLAKTYMPVLDNQFVELSAHERQEVIQEFRIIVGSIVILASPLSTSALARILDVAKEDVDGRLCTLHSVLSVPPSGEAPVKLLHQSFRDFLLDPKQRDGNAFWIDERQTHQAMATRCLRLMGCLRENICDMKSPGAPRSLVDQYKLKACLPSELQYACLYWVYHIQGAGVCAVDCEQVYNFLKRHFLHWIESLSLIGRARESMHVIEKLQSLCKCRGGKKLSDFLDDAIRFIRANMAAIDSTPLQLYSSFLTFAPERSVVRIVFEAYVWHQMSLLPKVESNWGHCVLVLEGHSGWVKSVAFSPDGGLVASGSYDATIRLWCVETGKCIQTLKGHRDWVNSVDFSPDGALVASSSRDQTARLWRVETGNCVKTLKGHSGWVNSVVFSPDGALVVSGSRDQMIRLWRVAMGKCIQTLKGHNSWIMSVAFSPDGELVASSSHDQTIRLSRIKTGKCVQTLKGHSGWVNSVAFSPDGSLVASSSRDQTARLWRVQTGKYVQKVEGHSSGVTSVTFSSDRALVASGSSDTMIWLWCVETGECIQTLKGHTYEVTLVAFSPNGALVASGSRDMTIRLWRVNTGECIQTLESYSVAFSPDSALVASGSSDTTIRLWRVETGECIQTLKGHSSRITSIPFSPDRALVASGSHDQVIRLWRVETGKCIQTLKGHSGWVNSVAFSPDSALVASGYYDKTIQLWRVNTGECIHTLDIQLTTSHISFEGCNSRLLTDHGTIELQRDIRAYSDNSGNTSSFNRRGYGISADRCWVTWNEENWFWLPLEYREAVSAISGSTVALGCQSGRITMMEFRVARC